MSDPDLADVQAPFCAVLVDEWARAGVTDAVVAPGSRSTPLLMALDANRRIRVHVVLDERCAGFVAAGPRAGDRPTGGGSHHERYRCRWSSTRRWWRPPTPGVPLIAVTADRPPSCIGVGAPQTVEQDGLFGRVALVGHPGRGRPAASGGWRSLAARSRARGRGGLGRAGARSTSTWPSESHCSARRQQVERPAGRPDDALAPRARPAGRPGRRGRSIGWLGYAGGPG